MNLTNPGERTFIWLSAAGKSWAQHTRASAGTLSTQFSSVAQLSLTLCHPMDCSMSGLPVHSRVYSNSCPSCWWCHPIISPSVIPFSSCLQSFPASGSFPMSWFFVSGGQSIGASASVISPSSEYSGLTPFGLNGLISLLSKGLWRVFCNTTVQKHQFLGTCST